MQNQQDNSAKSKRIASNTVILFARMFVLMIANLYAVRLLLNGLGKEDYGVFNAVSGVITTTAFVSSVLALSLQRFYSVSLGERNEEKGRDIFNASARIVFVISFLILVLFETIGIWFLNTKMTIPAGREDATFLVFQFTLVAFISSFVQIPFLAAIFAHEDMGIFSIVSTIECLGRVFAAFIVGKIACDGLVLYGFGYLVVGVFVMLMYIIYAMRKYQECHFSKLKDNTLYRKLLTFSGWATFGSLANTGMVQGGMILLNVFFGPLANYAFGISLQMNNAFNSLTNSIIIPFRPAMIKTYAEKNYDYLNRLFDVNNKVIYYFLLAVGLPIIYEMNTILNLWLNTSDEQVVLFSQLMVIYVIILAIHNPITIIMHASGKIMQYHLPVEIFTLLCFPMTWLAFYLGMDTYSIFIIMISCCILSHVVRVICLARYYSDFSVWQYILRFILPACVVTVVSVAVSYGMHSAIEGEILRLILMVFAVPVSVIAFAYVFGIANKERKIINNYILSTILHRK